MFSRASNLDTNAKLAKQNLKTEEFFEYIQQRNTDKIKEYFSNPEYKVWQLKDENGYTILHKAVFNGDMDITTLIINEVKKRLGMSSKDSLPKFINEKTNEGMTALHYAAYKGNIPLLQFLITSGASVDAVTNLGKNVIHMAAEGNQPSMMIYLITKEHQSSQSVDENGSTPLHWACYSGAEESVNFLLNLDVNIDAQDKEKLTPLHLAVLGGREKIVLKLLQKNANKTLTNVRGELPIDLARKKNQKRIAAILDDDDFNPLCSLQTPKYYIEPTDIYKRFILIMIIVPEAINYIFILPYLKDTIETFINVPAFILCLLTYFVFIGKDPGYKKNTDMEKKSKGQYPLIVKVDEGIDVRHYCSKCYIQKANNIKHCFICDKCVEDFNHHCFWINKCIGKNNRFFYFIFILFALIYTNHTLYISLELLLDDVNLPYDNKTLHIYIFEKERGFRVLGAATVGVFSLIVGLPLWFLLLIEILKTFGLYNYKGYDANSLENVIKRASKKDAKDVKQEIVELQGKEGEDALLPDEENEQLIKNDNKNIKNDNIDNNNIINNTIPINDVGDEIIINGEQHNIIPEGEEKPSMIVAERDNSLF
jgi:palmitoyltransferase